MNLAGKLGCARLCKRTSCPCLGHSTWESMILRSIKRSHLSRQKRNRGKVSRSTLQNVAHCKARTSDRLYSRPLKSCADPGRVLHATRKIVALLHASLGLYTADKCVAETRKQKKKKNSHAEEELIANQECRCSLL